MIPTYTEDRIRSQQNRTDSPDRYPDSDLERYPDWGSQESRGYYQESRPHHQAARRVDPYASRTGTAPMAGYGRDHATGPEPKDLVLGLLGGVAGVIAMDIFSQQIMPLLTQDQDQGNSGQSQDGGQEQEHALDSIAVISEHHRKSESATAALGRILYHWATDEDPDKQTKTTLSYLVHWGYGIAQGGRLRCRVDRLRVQIWPAVWPLARGFGYWATKRSCPCLVCNRDRPPPVPAPT
ncbi:MAG: hypothetical protein R2932_39130 [Caldilineaceae bacterium]